MQVITKKINIDEAIENNGLFEIEVPINSITLKAYDLPRYGQIIYFSIKGKESKRQERRKFQLMIGEESIVIDKDYGYYYRGTVTEYIYSEKRRYDGLQQIHVFEMVKEK